MIGVIFALGFSAIVVQTVLLREFLVVCAGTELSFALVLCLWLLGVSAGAATGAGAARRRRDASGALVACVLAQSVIAVLSILLARLARFPFPQYAGGYLPFWLSAVVAAILCVPVSFWVGFAFPVTVRCLDVEDRVDPAARVYAFEALGSLAGGVLYTFVLVSRLNAFTVVSVVSLACVLAVATSGRLRRGRRRGVILAATAIALAGLALAGHRIDAATQAIRYRCLQPAGDLVAYADSPYQNLSLGRYYEQYSLFGHGKLMGSFPDEYAAAQEAGIVLSQHPSAGDVLLVSPSDPQLCAAVLDWPVRRVAVAEIDPEVYDIIRPYLSPRAEAAFRDPRLVFHHTDARRFIAEASDASYDVIYMSLPYATTALMNRFYTQEFYRDVSRALRPGGIMAVRVTGSDTFMATLRPVVAGIDTTIRSVFDRTLVLPGVDTYFFAGNSPACPLTDAPDVLASRYRAAGAPEDHFGPEDFATTYIPAQIERARSELDGTQARVNTDVSPASFLVSLALWDVYSGSHVSRLGGSLQKALPVIIVAVFAAVLAAGVLFLRRETRLRVGRSFTVIAVVLVGACAMALEVVSLYLYQIRFGTVYQRVGLLVAVFMFGLTVSALLARRAVARSQSGALACGVALLLVCAALAVHLPFAGRSETVFFARLFAFALAVGFTFPLGVSLFKASRGATSAAAGVVDAADHLGAAIGAVVVGVVLFPLVGTFSTALVIGAALLLAAALLVIAGRILPRG